MGKDDIVVLHCNSCGKNTKHHVVCVHWWTETEQNSSGFFFDFECQAAIIICDHCNNPLLRKTKRCEQLSDDSLVNYLPPQPVRMLPSWTSELSDNMAQLLKETHAAFADRFLWLVAMGSRTLIDMFALEVVGDIGGFEKKLEKLENEKYLSSKDRSILKEALEVGHDATHRKKCPSFQDCQSALDIIEHLLQRLVVNARATDIRRNRLNGASS